MVSRKRSKKPKNHTKHKSKNKQQKDPQYISGFYCHQTAQDVNLYTSGQPLLEPICGINLRVPELTEAINVHSIKEQICKGKILFFDPSAEFEPPSRKHENRTNSKQIQRLKNRERKALSRANEPLPKREKRLANERERRALTRANETKAKRNKRLAVERERRALTRANETKVKRNKRLAVERERRALSRANETSADRQKRLVIERERRALTRANETSPEREKRLAIERERRALSRAQETPAERRRRLDVDRERRALARSNETLKMRHKLLNTKKKRKYRPPELDEHLNDKVEHSDVANANEIIIKSELDLQMDDNLECNGQVNETLRDPLSTNSESCSLVYDCEKSTDFDKQLDKYSERLQALINETLPETRERLHTNGEIHILPGAQEASPDTIKRLKNNLKGLFHANKMLPELDNQQIDGIEAYVNEELPHALQDVS